MRRRVVIVSVIALALVTLACGAAWKFLVVVPEAGADFGATRDALTSHGLVPVGRSPEGEPVDPLDIETVIEIEPEAGRVVLRGSEVRATVEPPGDSVVVMPDLLGRLDSDARSVLNSVGLRAPAGKPDPTAVVYSQETSAGSPVPFRTKVAYRAAFPHSPGGTSPAIKALHGVLYLRYGIEGTGACSKACHTANTCLGSGCHSAEAYRHLERAEPDLTH